MSVEGPTYRYCSLSRFDDFNCLHQADAFALSIGAVARTAPGVERG
jgi:hypothetical protein